MSTWRASQDEASRRAADERLRRTERQRERREQARVCGHCLRTADGGLLEWRGRRRPLLIPVCRACRALLAGCWRDMEQVGPWCPIDAERPCGDCSTARPSEKSQRGPFRRLFL